MVDLPMNWGDIADYRGLTLETVSRVLGLVKCRRLISLANAHEVKIEDSAVLGAMARGEKCGARSLKA